MAAEGNAGDTTVVTIWSDLHCPWATVAIQRLRAARDRHGLPVVFDQRPWPLEWVNEQGTPRHIVEPESHVLADHEPELFSAYRARTWPSTFLPAFELVAAARRALGLRAAEDVDHAVRLRFFRDGVDVSLRHELQRAAEDSGNDAEAIMRTWEHEPVRADVVADWELSKQLPIQGSPQIFWPDGSTDHNPGMTAHEWVRGLPRLDASALDPDEPERLLLRHAG